MTVKTSALAPRIASDVWSKPRVVDSVAKRALLNRLEQLEHGEIIMLEDGNIFRYGRSTSRCPLSVTITLHSPVFYSKVAFGGSIGAGEAYMAGVWDCDELTSLMRILVLNREVLNGLEKGLAWIRVPAQKVLHRLRANTRNGSRQNITAHYDQGNEFFSQFLDDTMMYSCAVFEHEQSSLREASIAKNHRICRMLQLSSQDHLLEIGTGWGGFAIQAAKEYGCRVTTTTISRSQYEFASERIKKEGLTDRITVLQEDYRDLNGRYDKLVSIEMIEAVGHAFYDTYFRSCSDLLRPDGMMALQAIVMKDQYYEQAKRSVDFIQRHIFPGSCIPSIPAICDSVSRVTDMRLFELNDIGRHYPPTLRSWKARLFSNSPHLRELGLSDSDIRMWEFYFSYCEGGFLEGSISNVQMLLVKPLHHLKSQLDSAALMKSDK